MRQLLADKVSGTALGLWLLVPEHLRLGTWDLVLGWAGWAAERVEPRLACSWSTRPPSAPPASAPAAR